MLGRWFCELCVTSVCDLNMCSQRRAPDAEDFLCFRSPALPDVLIRNNKTFNWMLGKDLSLELFPLSVERVFSFLLVFVCRERMDFGHFGCFGPGWKQLPGLGAQHPPTAPGSCSHLDPGRLHFVPVLSPLSETLKG